MCLLLICHRLIAEAPVLVAANREERFDRPSLPPRLHHGPPRFLGGVDLQAGGTWLGVNEHGLLVAVTNRPRTSLPPAPRSRGLLCRDLLAHRDAAGAAQRAFEELGKGRYAGANYVCLDATQGLVVHGGDRLEILDVTPGAHVMTNGDLDDAGDPRVADARRMLSAPDPDTGGPPATVQAFIDTTARACAALVERGSDRGTVSSQQIALTADPADAVCRHAPGPPDERAHDDLSPPLRELLSAADAARTPEP